MLKVQEIRELIKLVDQSNLDEFVYEFDDCKIKMKKHKTETVAVSVPQISTQAVDLAPQATAVEAAAVKQEVEEVKEAPAPEVKESSTTENLHKITSPMVGTFYEASSPDAEPYVKVGSKVSTDSIVCIVEAMKLFNEIEAEVKGEIVEILVKNGQLVEYGQPLFLVKPE
ncbi:acetyl-CoA carboxylase biotin carboxyl carrier protein [Robertmurraya andreesenii]|uniref:Biotin carboxyl carrier protein of acetyl-CoA carboxylase n=1 Tax=Anoxybacillus andreesenii TaxID=1325932 RepID=A0ABT9V6H4_9BACL|nr:acetyl-CoA carboxylase biotin carboxyl carrier protein [Robertmurraya andreesenii]MDQ0156435.1 acetyl-CoA carboxylase biotin carboxyl carrier protein [Robertmurraya andreesenii]